MGISDKIEFDVEDVKDIDNVLASPHDNFKRGALEVSGRPVVFVDPARLEGLDEAGKVAEFKNQLEEQIPEVVDGATNEGIVQAMEKFDGQGPFAMLVEYEGAEYCLVNGLVSDLDTKEELISFLSEMPEEKLKALPGSDFMYHYAVGVHEGEHCNQEPGGTSVDSLEREAKSDQASLDKLRENGHHEVAETIKNARALGAGASDAVHSTNILLDKEGAIEADFDHIFAARGFHEEILHAVKEELQLDDEGLVDRFGEHPEQMFDVVDRLLEQGKFDDMPEEKAFIEDLSEGFKALVKIEGGAPVIAQGDVKDSVQIGGVSASDYFKSYANPAMAQQRLENEKSMDVANAPERVMEQQSPSLPTQSL